MREISTDEILGPLNEQQRAAVSQIDGPLLILAGPGSGKTRVITHRIANIIAHGVPSYNIFALTFTNKAADEMRTRLKSLVPESRTWTGTFHRFCSRLLREHAALVGLKPNFTIYDMGDSKKVMKQAIANAEVDLRHYSADMLINQISTVKSSGVTAANFRPRPGHALDAIVTKVYPEYQKLLKLANGVDFDDLLLHAVDLLTNSPEIRESLDRKCTYMMVDEYQDTNLAQYKLIRLLNHTVQNLAVTGDPDQSIYGWRGANIRNILEFEKDYPDVNVVRLEQNYRSTKSILRIADQLISNNRQRKEKKLVTDNAEGDQARLVTFPSPQDEGFDIADAIALAIQKGERRPRDFAILYRANYLSRSLEHSLRSVGVPYQVVNGHEFYQRREIKDVIGYLHLLNNPDDNVALERVINVPPRKIGKVTLTRLRDYARQSNISMLQAARDCEQIDTISKSPTGKIAQFVAMYDRLAAVATEEVEKVVQAVLDETGYRDWLTADGSEEGFERARNVDELVVATQEYDRDHPDSSEHGGLEGYLEQAALVSDTDIWESEAEFVTLMTLHGAKGLEFPCVYIVGLEDGILPHERSSGDDNEIEEERRLLFVGITRAKEQLQISRCLNRFRKGSYWPAIASRFLMELPREEMQIFEPVSSHHFDDEALADSIADLDPWMHDGLPEIDINEDMGPSLGIHEGQDDQDNQGEDFGDVVRESIAAVQADGDSSDSFSAGTSSGSSAKSATTFPRIVTAAQIEAQQEAMQSHIRLHPESYEVDMEVEHPEYGVGLIVEITGKGAKRTATVDFERLGKKRFRLAFCNLRVS